MGGDAKTMTKVLGEQLRGRCLAAKGKKAESEQAFEAAIAEAEEFEFVSATL